MPSEDVILTPEKTPVTVRVAPLNLRMTAQFVDLMVVAGLLTAAQMILSIIGVVTFGPEASSGLVMFAGFVIPFLYFGLSEALDNGRTLGKRATSIRVVSADGTPVRPAQAWFRNLLRPADFLPALYAVGMVAMFTNPKGQRLGDLVAGTMVIHEPRAIRKFAAAVHTYGLHHFEQHVGDLNDMTLEEFVAMKRLCDRFPYIPPDEQQRALRDLWDPFAERHRIPKYNNVNELMMMEAAVMKFSRMHHLL